ncbi:MAG TPA: HAD-IIIA family hydrolase [Usitatibacter sp.]|jgi:3-deoxy-D-manno-octulosonate 8-phosphate phosphatase (KDO 8-P phosphatase)|nr:HAD-IIIA family hydrolase [Usitatibacter sp.]
MDALERARAVRLAIFDVDGVLTDGTLFIGAQGEVAKPFNILDGHGVKMLQHAGIATAIISGRSSEAVAFRARELSIENVIQGCADKVADFERLRARLAVDAQACSFMGDDLPDLAVMQRCGFAVAVANAVDAVKQAAHYVTQASGGRGAVREFCDFVLRARGQLADRPAG